MIVFMLKMKMQMDFCLQCADDFNVFAMKRAMYYQATFLQGMDLFCVN